MSARPPCPGCSTTGPGSRRPRGRRCSRRSTCSGTSGPIRLRGRSGLVGLVVPELENPIFPAFAQVMETLLAQHGYTPVLCTQTPGGVTEDEYVDLLTDRGVAGIIFVSGMHADVTADHAPYTALVERGLPIVLVNGYAEGVDAPFISDDDAAAMELAVTHLTSMGHRRIGLALGPLRFVPVVRKRAAFIDAMVRQTGISADEAAGLVSHSLFAVEGGQAAAHHLLGLGVTAIVCGSDLMALGAIRTVRQRGLRVPEDVSVVGLRRLPADRLHRPPADHRSAGGHGDGHSCRPGAHRRDQRDPGAAGRVRLPARARGALVDRSCAPGGSVRPRSSAPLPRQVRRRRSRVELGRVPGRRSAAAPRRRRWCGPSRIPTQAPTASASDRGQRRGVGVRESPSSGAGRRSCASMPSRPTRSSPRSRGRGWRHCPGCGSRPAGTCRSRSRGRRRCGSRAPR